MPGESFGQARHSERVFRKEEVALPIHDVSSDKRDISAKGAEVVKTGGERRPRTLGQSKERIDVINSRIKELEANIKRGEKVAQENKSVEEIQAKERMKAEQEILDLLEEKIELEG